MEEMVSSDALEKEILEDARKKGERLLKDAETEKTKLRAEHEERLRAALESLGAEFRQRADRHRNENLARLPLEKGRMKASHVDSLIKSAVASYLEALPAERAGFLVSGLVAKASGILEGAELELRCKGLSPAAAEELVRSAAPGARILAARTDEGLPAWGIVALALPAAGSGSARLTVRATLDLVGERLLDRFRGELATALCAEALSS